MSVCASRTNEWTVRCAYLICIPLLREPAPPYKRAVHGAHASHYFALLVHWLCVWDLTLSNPVCELYQRLSFLVLTDSAGKYECVVCVHFRLVSLRPFLDLECVSVVFWFGWHEFVWWMWTCIFCPADWMSHVMSGLYFVLVCCSRAELLQFQCNAQNVRNPDQDNQHELQNKIRSLKNGIM